MDHISLAGFSVYGLLGVLLYSTLGLYMLFTGHFPGSLLFSLGRLRLQRTVPDSSGVLVQVAGGLLVLGAAVAYLSNESFATIFIALFTTVLGLICLVISYFQ